MPRDLRPAPTPFLRWPDPRLATSGARAIRADAPTLAQLELLAEILERYGLPALAGPQIGVMRRLAVMRVDGRAEPMLNPALVWASRDRQAVEATSPNFPGVRAAVERAAVATLGWTTPGGERREKVFSGPRAAEAQAMLDAVEGRPLIDLLDPAERRRALRDMALAKAGGGPGAPDAPPGAEPDAAPAPAPMDPPAAPSPDAEESPKGPAMRLIFMGTPDFSVLALDALVAAGHEIAAVYTQPPRPAGRGKKPRPTPVHARAEALGLEVRHPKSLKGEDEQAALAALGADLAVVVAYGLILPRPVLDAPRLGCVNIHASLLPRWRGAAPIQRAIMAGDAETGVCIMRMEAGLDTGPVLTRRATPIGAADTAETLHDRLAAMGAEMIVEAAALLADGAAEETPQPEEGVTYAAKIDKAEARIDWTKPAAEVDRQVRGLSPFPGAWFEHEGARIKALMSCLADGSGAPGETLDDALTVACGQGAVRLSRIQRAGKGAMATEDALRGLPIPKGAALG